MKRLILMLVALALLAGGCKYFEPGKKKKVDPVALQKAREDSIRNARMLEAERLRLAREQATQDSLRAVREYEAKYRFHVIIGSFKIPSNATSWEQEVHNLGFRKTKITEAPNGFSLVSVGWFDSYSAAFNEIERINSSLEEPWELWVYEKL